MNQAVVGRQRRAPRKPKPQADQPGLTREAIVAAAIRLIDATELENFSMRNLAKELGVYPTAIYWHIPSRNAVVAEVISEVLRGIAPALPLDWKMWLKSLFRNYREAIRRHPNVAPLIGVQLVSNTSVDLDMIESILTVLNRAGCPPERLRAAYNAVIATMVGFTTQEFAMVPKEEAAEWAIGMRSVVASVQADSHPILANNINDMANTSFILRWQNGADAPMDDSFELFVDSFITGLEVIIGVQRRISS